MNKGKGERREKEKVRGKKGGTGCRERGRKSTHPHSCYMTTLAVV